MKLSSLLDFAKEHGTVILTTCPICGHELRVTSYQGRYRIQCMHDDKVHNLFRDRHFMSDESDIINEWNSYCCKILSYRKWKPYLIGAYYLLTILPMLGLFVYSHFQDITFFSVVFTLLLMALPYSISMLGFYKHLIAITGTDYVKTFQTDHEYFLTAVKVLEKDEQSHYDKALLEKMIKDKERIKAIHDLLEDDNMKESVKQLISISEEIAAYLTDHPSHIQIASTFTNIYQQSVLNILQEYVKLLHMQELQSTLQLLVSIRDTLSNMDKLYKREYDKITASYTLDISSELRVLQEEIGAITNE